MIEYIHKKSPRHKMQQGDSTLLSPLSTLYSLLLLPQLHYFFSVGVFQDEVAVVVLNSLG